MGSRRRAVGAVIASVAFAVLAGPAEAAQVTEVPIPPGAAAGAHGARVVTQGPGGMLWFTDHADKSVGRVGTDGVFLPRIPTHDSRAPEDIAASADGWVYWTVDSDELEWRNPNGVVGYSALNSLYTYGVAVAADGTVFWTDRNYSPPMLGRVCKGVASTTCQVLPGQSSPPARQTDITLGPDGKWWVTGFEEDRVRRVTSGLDPDLAIDLPSGSHPYRIVWGPDDNMWATDYGASSLDRITTAGVRTRFPLPPGTGPNDIVTGPDGALWFTEFDAGRIGRLTTGGQFNDFPLPTPNSHPWGITVGPDGAIWFTEATSGNVGRLVLDQPGGGGAGGGGQITDTFA